MVKKLLFIMISVCVILFCHCSTSKAKVIISDEDNNFYIDLYNTGIYSNTSEGKAMKDQEKKDIIAILQKTFGYSGDNLTAGQKTMRFRTKIKITNKNDYTIQIGEDARDDDKQFKPVIKKVKKEELAEKYGYNEKDDSWEVVMIGGLDYNAVPRMEIWNAFRW